MGSSLPTNAPIGRLFDSIDELAEKIRTVARDHSITVWTDERGSVFAMSEATLAGVPIETAVGTYGSDAPAAAIERDLLQALQQRSTRMFDWNEDDEEFAQPQRQPIRRRHHAYS